MEGSPRSSVVLTRDQQQTLERAHAQIRELSADIRSQLSLPQTVSTEENDLSVRVQLQVLQAEVAGIKAKLRKNDQWLQLKEQETSSLHEATMRLELATQQLAALAKPTCCDNSCSLL